MQIVSKLVTSIIIAAFFAGPAFANESGAEFVRKATQATNFEVESSKLALKRATNPEVKSFAQKMIDDHTSAAKKMKEAAAKDNVDAGGVPNAMDEKDAKTLTKLKEVEAKDFDEAYMDAQETAHKKTVDLFEDYASNGDAPNLKLFAAETLPTLKGHGKHADEIEGKVD